MLLNIISFWRCKCGAANSEFMQWCSACGKHR